MGGRVGPRGLKAQAALFALLGIIILLAVIIAFNLLRQSETTAMPPEQASLSVETALEAGRMQERVDRCLGEIGAATAEELAAAGVTARSRIELEGKVAQQVALDFSECFYRQNTQEKLTITAADEPRVRAALTDEELLLDVEYAVEGAYDGETYPLTRFTATVLTGLALLVERQSDVEQQIAGALAGTIDDGFIDKEGYVDFHHFADQGIYLDMLLYDDGSCAITLYDTNTDDLGITTRYYERCTP